MAKKAISARKRSEKEAQEMSDFWNAGAKGFGGKMPDPQPLLMHTSVLMMIHRLAENLASQDAKEIQATNYRVFKRMERKVGSMSAKQQ